MDILSIFLIALGLSMDSFAVSVSNGLSIKNLTLSRNLLIAFSLAFFQAIFPLIGWFIGIEVVDYIRDFDHWIAFVLLSFIGLKMVYEGLQSDEQSKGVEFSFKTLIMQSIATSIDAFVVGVSFALLDYEIAMPIVIIGVTTFIVSIIGLKIGNIIGDKIGKSVEIFGGIVLIGIGTKILIEHLYF